MPSLVSPRCFPRSVFNLGVSRSAGIGESKLSFSAALAAAYAIRRGHCTVTFDGRLSRTPGVKVVVAMHAHSRLEPAVPVVESTLALGKVP